MNYDDFKNSPSGQLTKMSDIAGEYFAFIPNPLPPDLEFNRELLSKISNADRLLGRLRGLTSNLVNPRLLYAPLFRKEALVSSQIEGTISTINDLYSIQAEKAIEGRDEIDELIRINSAREVYNYVRALDTGLELLNNLPISKRFFQDLHRILLENVRGENKTPGEFRKTQNAIGEYGTSVEDAKFIPPPVSQMHKALDALEIFINSPNRTYPPLVDLALIHYQFETIHPFLDGNGRIGRLLLPLILCSWDLLENPTLLLSVYLNQNRQIYYKLLYDVSAKGDWHSWIDFFLDSVIYQLNATLADYEKVIKIQQEWEEKLIQTNASAKLLSVVDHLFIMPIISAPHIAEFAETSWRTASNWIEKLMEVGILEYYQGSENPKYYCATDILNIIR